MPGQKTEGEIQKEILKFLKTLQSQCIFTKIMSASLNGWPDIQGTAWGLSVYFEVKKPSGIVPKHQRARHNQIILAGGYVYVVRDVYEVKQIMDTLKRKARESDDEPIQF